MVKKSKTIPDMPEEEPQKVSDDRYVIRLIKDKYKAIKFNPKKMKLGRFICKDGTENIESTYTKSEVDELIRKGKKDKSIEPVTYL